MVKHLSEKRVIKSNQKQWLNRYIELHKNAKNGFEKYFSKVMNNSALGKNMKILRKQRCIKLLKMIKEEVFQYLSQAITRQNEKLSAIKMNKSVYLAFSMLEKLKWTSLDMIRLKKRYNLKKMKLCYIDTNSFLIHIKNKFFIVRDDRREKIL